MTGGEVLRPDLCILGAGSAGLSVAAGAVQMGASVVLIEKGEMGGDCLNAGCVPSKALIAAAAQAAALRRGVGFGIGAEEPRVDYAAVMAHVAGTIATIAPHDSEARFAGLGVRVIRAAGRFTGPEEVEAGEVRVRARFFILATGSRPLVPPIPGLEGVPFLTNETIFGLREAPGHLLILGGGAIGVEMAQAHVRLGVPVTLVEAGRILGRDDPEAVAVVRARLEAEGVGLIEGAKVARVEAGPVLVLEDGRRVAGTHLLVAAGRVAVTEGLGLEAAGIRGGPKGIAVDAGLRTANRRVLAIGDAAGGPMFTHVAGYHAGIAIRRTLFRLPVRPRLESLPRVTFTAPELAQAGVTEAEARAAHGAGIEVLRAEFAGNDRAVAERETEGFAKLVVRRGRILGATIVGAGAGELLLPVVLAIGSGLRVGALAGMIAPYPTRSEILKRAAGQYYVPRLFGNPRVRAVIRFLSRF